MVWSGYELDHILDEMQPLSFSEIGKTKYKSSCRCSLTKENGCAFSYLS